MSPLGRAALTCLAFCSCTEGSSKPAINAADAGPLVQTVTVATGLKEPILMLADGKLLLISDGDHRLVSTPVNGGGIGVLVSSNVERLVGLDAEQVFFLAYDGLYRIAKAGGLPTRVSDGRASAAGVSDGTAYWADADVGSGLMQSIKAASVAGGGPSLLGAVRAGITSLAATKQAVFLTNPVINIISRNGLPDGGTPTLPSYPDQCDILLADNDSAYCASASRGPIARIGADGSVSKLAEAATLGLVALDENYVYFQDIETSTGPRSVRKISKRGGDPVVVSKQSVTAIAADDAALYWAYGGTIYRQQK